MISRRRLLVFLATGLLSQPGIARAGVLQVLPGDNPLEIQGKVGNDASFVKKVGLFAHQPMPGLIFRSTDLRRLGDTDGIGHPQVVPIGTAKFDLQANTPLDFEIMATGIKVPGTYQGKIYFLQPVHGMSPLLEIPIEVKARGVPKLSPRKGSESVKIQLVNCGTIGCFLGQWRWLQPDAYPFPSNYPLQFDNGSLEQFHMAASVTAIGDATRESLDQTLSVPSNVKVPPELVYTLPISVSSVMPPPDHYVGDIQMRLPDQDAPIKIPLEVNVRFAPLLPVFLLLLGILFGRALKHMQDKGSGQLSAHAVAAPQLPGYVRPLTYLTGHSAPLKAEEARPWLVRPLAYILLIAYLVYQGVQQLYLKNATFGSNPVSDYLGILTWATSSDIASRTLSTIRIGSS